MDIISITPGATCDIDLFCISFFSLYQDGDFSVLFKACIIYFLFHF